MLAHRFRLLSATFSVILLAGILCSSSSGQGEDKVAVLYFTSEISSCPGCGCFCVWPLSLIFKSEQTREDWDLKSGFRDILNERLTEAGYNIIEPGYVDQVLQEAGSENMTALAEKLGADIMITGNIKKFQQHRTRASSEGPTVISSVQDTETTTAQGQDTGRLTATGGFGGYHYSASVKTDVTIYDSSGDELESSEISLSRDLSNFYMGVGPLTKNRYGGDAGKKDSDLEYKPPIVDYDKLDTMKFGTDEFKYRTLFGMAAIAAMDEVVAKVNEYLEPDELKTIEGKIIYVGTGERLKENEVYIDLGAGDGIKTGYEFGIYIGSTTLTDPDSGEELGAIPEKKVGMVKVSKIEADHLSIAEIIEKTGQIERGNIIRRE
jgi:curli biogenesis system outer membrane secretion channel CsgG